MDIFGVGLNTIIALTLSASILTQMDFESFTSSDSNEAHRSTSPPEAENLRYQDPIIDRLIDKEQNPREINEGSRAVIYTRVSSIRDENENKSLGDQEDRLDGVASRQNYELPYETLKDGNQSGQNFNREGIQRVEELAVERKISYLLVDSLDRIGRDFVQTMDFVAKLRDHGVVIVTYNRGRVDIDNDAHLLLCATELLGSDVIISTGGERISKGKRAAYERKEWTGKTGYVPFGYEKNGRGWLKKNKEQAAILDRAFDTFLDVSLSGPYAKTVDLVPELKRHGIDAGKLRRVMPRPINIGKPTFGIHATAVKYGEEDPSVIVDEDLKIVSEEVFEKYLDKRDALYERYSNGKSGAVEVDDIVENCGLPATERSTTSLKLHCENPHCSAVMTYDGLRSRAGNKIHQYVCPDCGAKRRYPRVSDVKQIIGFLSGLVDDLRKYL